MSKPKKYHDKVMTHKTAFSHTRKQEVKMMKEWKKRHGDITYNKSELLRELIDSL